MARDTRANKEFSPRTQETARWAREQIKRQTGKFRRLTLMTIATCPMRVWVDKIRHGGPFHLSLPDPLY